MVGVMFLNEVIDCKSIMLDGMNCMRTACPKHSAEEQQVCCIKCSECPDCEGMCEPAAKISGMDVPEHTYRKSIEELQHRKTITPHKALPPAIDIMADIDRGEDWPYTGRWRMPIEQGSVVPTGARISNVDKPKKISNMPKTPTIRLLEEKP